MEQVVERILMSYRSGRANDVAQEAGRKEKVARYLETLASAGQRDAELLMFYGLAYLKELHEGKDARYSGC